MNNTKLFFRADGNHTIGLGHIVRSLALVEMVNGFFECVFITRQSPPAIIDLIKKVCDSVLILPENNNYEEEAIWIKSNILTKGSILILDGYNFTTEYQRIIKSTNCKLICIDDIHSCHFLSDVVINHAPGSTKEQYSAEPYTKFFLGEKYALLRKQFLSKPVKKKSRLKENNLFICFGGADYYNITLKVIKAVQNLQNILNINVVLGNSFLYEKEIEEYKLKRKINQLNIYKNLNADEMFSLMNSCTLAICPASSVAFESLALNMKLITGYTAENQKEFYHYLILKGIIGVDSFKNATIKHISAMINELFLSEKNNLNLIDGKSPERILKIFNQL